MQGSACVCMWLRVRVVAGARAYISRIECIPAIKRCCSARIRRRERRSTRDVSARKAAARFGLGHTTHPPAPTRGAECLAGGQDRDSRRAGRWCRRLWSSACARSRAYCRNDLHRGRCGCGPAMDGGIRSATSACLNSSASSNAALQLRRVSSRHWLKAWTYRSTQGEHPVCVGNRGPSALRMRRAPPRPGS